VTETGTQHFRAEHARMARDLAEVRRMADELPELAQAQRSALVTVAVDLFRRFQRHALAEERDFYPKLTTLLGDPRPAAAMTYDHRALELGTAELAALHLLDVPRLQALLYGLHTLLTAHMRKEDEIVFPMLEQPKIETADLQRGVAKLPPPWDAQLSDWDPCARAASHP
jgi:hemerythrin-like domain-containing protein